jgi:hypothetical protein
MTPTGRIEMTRPAKDDLDVMRASLFAVLRRRLPVTGRHGRRFFKRVNHGNRDPAAENQFFGVFVVKLAQDARGEADGVDFPSALDGRRVVDPLEIGLEKAIVRLLELDGVLETHRLF